MWRRALSGLECFLFKVIKVSDHKERRSNWLADERKMKHKHKTFDVAHSPILPCTLPFLCMKDHAWVDLWRGVTIKPCLNYSNFHLSYSLIQSYGYPSTHTYTHSSFAQRSTSPFFFIGPFEIWLSNEIWLNESALRQQQKSPWWWVPLLSQLFCFGVLLCVFLVSSR